MIKVSSKKFQEALLQKRGFTGYKLIFDGLLTSMVGVYYGKGQKLPVKC